MRPSAGGDALPPVKPRSRKSSIADRSAAYNGASNHAPTTFFLRSEADMEQSLASSHDTSPSNRQRDSTFGVQSLEDTLEAAFGKNSDVAERRAEYLAGTTTPGLQRRSSTTQRSPSASPTQSQSSRTSSATFHRKKASSQASVVSSPPLSVNEQSSTPPSVPPRTPKSVSVQSLRLWDGESNADDVASQAMASSGDEDEELIEQTASRSFPQLVMPSIQMPARRPFTNRGKAMSKLKILFAGEAGIGKTALIRSIVQSCEDIVHVDPFAPSQSFAQSSPPESQAKSRKRRPDCVGTTRITEIHASTKSYPHWWSDIEESRVLRRRKSSSDMVLERNLCFIDTPGFGKGATNANDMTLVIDYVESLLYQTSSMTSLDDNDLLGVISGRGGVHVDVVIYLLAPNYDISKDIEYMQRLSALTNVIPIIAKSDTLSLSEIVAIKTSILARLQTTTVRPFLFGDALDDALLAVQGLSMSNSSASSPPAEADSIAEAVQNPFQTPTHPYAISSTPGPDNDTMDASLLMSPDYIQPLCPSELAIFIDQLFDPDSISWLRHTAAKKFLAWRRRTKLPGDPRMIPSLTQQAHKRGSVSSSSVGLHGSVFDASATSSIFSAASPSGVLVPRTTSPYYLSNPHLNLTLQTPSQVSSPSLSHSPQEGLEGPPDFSLARYHNAAYGEQRLAEVRLAKWATELQKSLRNERERFEELQRNERATWLLERVGEEVRDGNIVTSCPASPRADWAVVRHKSDKDIPGPYQKYVSPGKLDFRDPLGLCDLSDEVKRRGFVLVKVLGGMSVFGAVAVAVARACGVDTGLVHGGLWSWLSGGSSE